MNEEAEEQGLGDVSTHKIKTILNFWAIKQWLKRQNLGSKNHIAVLGLHPQDLLTDRLRRRQALAKYIVEYLYEKSQARPSENEEVLVDFSVHELKAAYEVKSMSLSKTLRTHTNFNTGKFTIIAY